jgi:hypothetical protein
MSTSNVIVNAVITVLIVVVFVVIINYTIPFFKLLEVQNLGKEYFGLMEINGGLTVSQGNEIETFLINKGYENVVVNYTLKGTAILGDKLNLRIDSEVVIREFVLFKSSKKNIPTDFESEVYYRKVEE